MANSLFETQNNYIIPNGKYMFKAESDMAMATMCAYP